MSATIYYFSGTGNSYAIAKSIAEGLQAELISMASAVKEKETVTGADNIGIVFPIYYMDVPNIIRQFIPKLADLSSKYIFVVCTYGGGQGHAIKTVRGLIRKIGGRLAAAYGIHMPQNAFLKPKEERGKVYANADNMVKLICSRTEKRKRGFRATEPVIDFIMRLLAPILKSVTRGYFIKTLQCGKDVTDQELISQMDKTFGLNEHCAGCGLCARICPVGNIVMEAGKLTWTHHCENCLACYNLCPNKAITSQIAKNGYYYLHAGYSAKAAKDQKATIV